MKALCLDTQLENINNDELDMDSCSTNVQRQEEHITNDTCVDDASFCEWIDISRTDELARKYDELEEEDTFDFFPTTKEKYYEVFSRDNAIKEEYYELYPYDTNQDKTFGFICKSLILFMKLSMEAFSPLMKCLSLLGSNNLFICQTPMHHKRVRLRSGYDCKCSIHPYEVKPQNYLIEIY
jgi:hypothetical protein